MKNVEEYLRHADECDGLARKAISAEQREQIVTMAATWRMLAEQRRARILKQASEAAEAAAQRR
jgi:hypothetical protein